MIIKKNGLLFFEVNVGYYHNIIKHKIEKTYFFDNTIQFIEIINFPVNLIGTIKKLGTIEDVLK